MGKLSEPECLRQAREVAGKGPGAAERPLTRPWIRTVSSASRCPTADADPRTGTPIPRTGTPIRARAPGSATSLPALQSPSSPPDSHWWREIQVQSTRPCPQPPPPCDSRTPRPQSSCQPRGTAGARAASPHSPWGSIPRPGRLSLTATAPSAGWSSLSPSPTAGLRTWVGEPPPPSPPLQLPPRPRQPRTRRPAPASHPTPHASRPPRPAPEALPLARALGGGGHR